MATAHVQAELISETTAIQPGQPFWVALRLQMRDGWHVYWRNPGDSGLAPTVTWTLPAGFSAGEIQWPYPERIPVGPLMNFGYHGTVVLPVQIQPLSSLPDQDTFTLRARADWLVCQEDCIPESADLELTLPTQADPAPM
ncbi:MAG TPA: protein-disulfide reductase DsbD family protein, partial [Candidatus Competibacter phosphatis]|nr:protein-disulfide reductase DsbD family protein [Candidatus Competibacter phosphatis]